MTLLKIKIEKGYKKDIERDKKSGKYSQLDFDILKHIIETLQEEKPVDPIYKRHPLLGTLNKYEAMHVKSDWILVFKIEKPFLILVMIGTHPQVYKKSRVMIENNQQKGVTLQRWKRTISKFLKTTLMRF